MNVRIGNDNASPALLVFKETYGSDMILAQNAVEHIIRLLKVWSLHRDSAKFD